MATFRTNERRSFPSQARAEKFRKRVKQARNYNKTQTQSLIFCALGRNQIKRQTGNETTRAKLKEKVSRWRK